METNEMLDKIQNFILKNEINLDKFCRVDFERTIKFLGGFVNSNENTNNTNSLKFKDLYEKELKEPRSFLVYANEKNRKIYFENVIKVEFENVFSKILIELIETADVFCSKENFLKIYEFSFHLRKKINDVKYLDVRKLLKNFINFTYGYFSIHSKTPEFIIGLSKINGKINNFYNELIVDYFDNIIYIDTDKIYLKNPADELLVKLDEFCKNEKSKINFILLNKKKYIEIDSSDDEFINEILNKYIKIRGIKKK